MDSFTRGTLLIPLDDRPCCLQFVERLAEMAGESLITPPAAWLGRFLQAGQPERLIGWYHENRPRAEKAIVSLDMLAFGGLVASRRPQPALRVALERLERWLPSGERGGGWGCKGVWAFQSVLRTAPTQTTAEETKQAQILLELSGLVASQGDPRVPLPRGKGATGGDGVTRLIEGLKASLPSDVLDAYLATRERNHALNAAALDWVRQGKLEGLLLGIDDSKTAGWNVLEVARLMRDLPPAAHIAPGTDETAQLLLARLCHPGRPITLRWSHPQLPDQITRYEDRSLQQLVRAQMAAAGLSEAENSPWQLWIFGRPEKTQGEAEEQAELPLPQGFLADLRAALGRGQRIVVADVAHANGGDIGLGRGLAPLFPQLLGYSAWNTAGNSMGTALACLGCAAEHPDSRQTASQQRFLWERWLDDLVYQSLVRPQLKRELADPGLTLGEQALRHCENGLPERLRQASGELGLTPPPGFKARLPWSRLFEIEVEVA